MTERTENGAVKLSFDADRGIATLTLEMEGRANILNEAFGLGLHQALEWLGGLEGLKGVCLGSGHRDFCAGADLDFVYRARDPQVLWDWTRQLGGLYRRLETLGVPVVALIEGAALGGGYELALAAHHRICLDDNRIQVGLPEVNLGVLPGAGGTQRLSRMIGLQKAAEAILQGKILRPDRALKAGFVDQLAADGDDLRRKAVDWITSNPRARQPWDNKGFQFPEAQPGSEDARNLFMVASAMLYKKTAGAFRSPEVALSVIQEGAPIDFDRALELEGRAFVSLATSDQAKDMIRTLWFHRQAAEKHRDLPSTDDMAIHKVGILGAGMMGAGLAFVCAQRGFEVVVKDITEDALEAARTHLAEQAAKRLRHLDEAGRSEVLGRIVLTLDAEPLDGCDLVIEAVIEKLEVKHAVTRELAPRLAAEGIWASNTSAIPITDLAAASEHPERFIGLHFFSPVEQMPLLEIITTEQTDERTLARCLAFCRAIKKLPIVVNDRYGFYTTRVFSAYILEGAQLVAEGHDPVLVEWAARQAGMVVPPLQVFDEVTLSLGHKAMAQAEAYIGPIDLPGVDLVRRMVEDHDRTGKAAGKGFYDYEGGRRIWPGLAELTAPRRSDLDVDGLAERLLLIQCVEAARAVDEGILRHHRDAEVGAIFGIGFAPGTGGPLSCMDRMGLAQVVARLDELASEAGARFAPPQVLRDMVARGERFFEEV